MHMQHSKARQWQYPVTVRCNMETARCDLSSALLPLRAQSVPIMFIHTSHPTSAIPTSITCKPHFSLSIPSALHSQLCLAFPPPCPLFFFFVRCSLQIFPKASAMAAPVGLGRSDPNANPHLPPPSGRMKLVRFLFTHVHVCMYMLLLGFVSTRTPTKGRVFQAMKEAECHGHV